MARRAAIVGTGSALPVRRVDNHELAKTVDTSDEWIVERTGIRARYIAGEGETTVTLGAEAAKNALAAAGIDASEVGLIVLATSTPDQTFPSSATKIQTMLGIADCIAFDVQAVCSGFLYAITVAESMIRSGSADIALVIGSETFSRILDWEDRGTCVLFGDGAGAVVLKAEDGERGILATRLHADGRYNDLLYVDGGPSTTGTVGKLRMKGGEVFRHAVVNLANVLIESLAAAGLSTGRCRLGGAAPGQSPDHRCHRPQARPAGGEGGGDDRRACQYLGRLGAAGAGRRGARRAGEARRPGRARGDGRRFCLGRGGGPLLTMVRQQLLATPVSTMESGTNVTPDGGCR